MRRSTRLPLEALAPNLLEARLPAPGEPVTLLDWAAIFGNDRPVEIEVGCGKGLFLLTSALARPDVNFLGIEIVRKYQLFTATRMAKRGLGNVRMSCLDARELLRQLVPAGSVQALHVYFPDPWWKKRHHKRRVFTDDFVASAVRVLRPGGHLHIATDVEAYFHVIRELVESRPEFRVSIVAAEETPIGEQSIVTNFERKAREQGTAVHRLRAERLAPSVPSPLVGEG